jgi:hypothetical protein
MSNEESCCGGSGQSRTPSRIVRREVTRETQSETIKEVIIYGEQQEPVQTTDVLDHCPQSTSVSAT